MTDSNIEWTERTWNPLAGCTLESPGCAHCYAMNMARRLEAMGTAKYAGTTKTVKGKAVWTGKINFDEKALLAPLKRKKPTVYFVNSMSDLFHEDVSDDLIDQVFAVMALCPQHTFQVLTKRSGRMREYLTVTESSDWRVRMQDVVDNLEPNGIWKFADHEPWVIPSDYLDNIWLGVSVEDQKRADERIPDLLATPATVRWLSMEPLLGPVNMLNIDCSQRPELPGFYWINALTGENDDMCRPCRDVPKLDWIVVGGESGPGARDMQDNWAREIQRDCGDNQIPYFMKQMGGANKARMREIPADLLVRQYPK